MPNLNRAEKLGVPQIRWNDLVGHAEFEGRISDLNELLKSVREVRSTMRTGVFRCSGLTFQFSCPRLFVNINLGRSISTVILEEFKFRDGKKTYMRSDAPGRPRLDGRGNNWLELRCGSRCGIISIDQARKDFGIDISVISGSPHFVSEPSAIRFQLFPGIPKGDSEKNHPYLKFTTGMIGWLENGVKQSARVQVELVKWWEPNVTPEQLVGYAGLAVKLANKTINTILEQGVPSEMNAAASCEHAA
jgi:hypothetical protein